MPFPSESLTSEELPIEIKKNAKHIIYMLSNLDFQLVDKIKPEYEENEIPELPMTISAAEIELNKYLSEGWELA